MQVRSTAGGPIYNVLISLPSLQLQRKTGPKGQSYIDQLRPGTHQLHISAPGYEPVVEEVQIREEDGVVVQVVLEGV